MAADADKRRRLRPDKQAKVRLGMATLEELEERVTKRREVDMIVKMRVDQLQRENVFASSARLEAVMRIAEDAQERTARLEKQVAALEAQLASLKR